MANPEHVEIVKKGADAIAACYTNDPGFQLDLSESDLRRINLNGADLRAAKMRGTKLDNADLRSAHLCGADLCGAVLDHAYINGADLSYANLIGVDVRYAHLYKANLRDANLTNAILIGAHLHDANLIGADLRGADLTAADLLRTVFGHTDLGETKGLGGVNYSGPCTIGVDTLFKSRGKIPDVFLRGCGVPEELIVQLPAIIESMQPIQFYSCFISYSTDDDAFARRLLARLKDEKLQVFFAPEDMKGGEKSEEQIDRAIRLHDRLLLVLSEKSMDSEWVRREIEQAREKEKQTGRNVLFPIALVPYEKIRAWKCLDVDSGEDLAMKVRAYHMPDFSSWKQEDDFEKAFADLMRDLRAKAENGNDEGNRGDTD